MRRSNYMAEGTSSRAPAANSTHINNGTRKWENWFLFKSMLPLNLYAHQDSNT